jgi:hypothetical protein
MSDFIEFIDWPLLQTHALPIRESKIRENLIINRDAFFIEIILEVNKFNGNTEKIYT